MRTENNSKYKSNKNPSNIDFGNKVGYFQKDGSATTIYIGNMIYAKNEKDIQKMFQAFGPVKYAKIVVDNETEMSKGFGFVQMTHKKHADKAIKELNGSDLDGRTLKVSIAVERDSDKKNFVQAQAKVARRPKGKTDNSTTRVKDEEEQLVPTPRRRRDKGGLKVLFNYLDS